MDIGSKRVIGDQQLTPEEENRIIEATLEAKDRDWDIASGHKFYLCDSMEETEFVKNSRFGIRGHRVFNLESVLNGNVPTDLKGSQICCAT